MAIQQDQTTTSTLSSFSFNHAANALVIVVTGVDLYAGGSSPTAVTIGGDSMTLLTTATLTSYIESKLWYAFRPNAATETIALTGGSGYYSVVVSETGTAQSEPFFENTATATSISGTSCSVSVAAGTAGRRVFGGNWALSDQSLAISPASSFTEINEGDWAGAGYYVANEIEYYDQSAATSAGGSANRAAEWAIIGTAILPYVTVLISFSDSGLGADAVPTLQASFTVNDSVSGQGVDSLYALSATINISDVGSLVDFSIGSLFDSGVAVDGVPYREVGILDSSLATEFAWRLKGYTLIDSFQPPHVLSIRIRDEADMDTRLIQGGSLPKQKMLGKPGRVVEIEGWTKDQDDIDDMEALMDGTARTFLHPSGDSFAVLVTGFDPESRVDEYDRRIYRLTLKETR